MWVEDWAYYLYNETEGRRTATNPMLSSRSLLYSLTAINISFDIWYCLETGSYLQRPLTAVTARKLIYTTFHKHRTHITLASYSGKKVNLSLCTPMKRLVLQLLSLWTWALDRYEWPTCCSGSVSPWKESWYISMEGSVGPEPGWTLWRREKNSYPSLNSILGLSSSQSNPWNLYAILSRLPRIRVIPY
jgi:hypothetical protein